MWNPDHPLEQRLLAHARQGTLYLLGLGANLGDTLGAFRRALTGLEEAGISVLAVSSVVQTPPMGPQDQPDFHNACAWITAEVSPEVVLRHLVRLESEAGRIRDRHWGPRTLDLDLLWWSGGTVRTATLTLPHPGLEDRDFVVYPALELPLGLHLLELMRPSVYFADPMPLPRVAPPVQWLEVS